MEAPAGRVIELRAADMNKPLIILHPGASRHAT
jgi:hypothetical protein